jgi:hypothetical protein
MTFKLAPRTSRTVTVSIVAAFLVAAAGCSPATTPDQRPPDHRPEVPSASGNLQGGKLQSPDTQPTDPAVYRGAGLAHLGCPQCHDIGVAGAGPAANAAAPPFASVANREGMTEVRIQQWLRGSHPTMPGYFMDDQTNSDLAAYIMSLRRKF